MDTRTYTTAAAEALLTMMDEIAGLHLPPGMSLQGPGAEDTARWLRKNLDEIGARMGGRLAGVEPPPELTGFHEQLLAQYVRPDDDNQLTDRQVHEWNEQLRELCESAGVAFPFPEQALAPITEEEQQIVDTISELVHAPEEGWEETVRAALGDMDEAEKEQVIAYLRELREESR